MPAPPDKPTRPQRRFSAIKRPTRRGPEPGERPGSADPTGNAPDEIAASPPPEVTGIAAGIPPEAAVDAPADLPPDTPPDPPPGIPPAPAAVEHPARQPSRPSASPPRAEKISDGARIAKVMARAGLCSRRDAEAWIAAGRVAVNGTVLSSPALDIGPTDVVTVDGYPIDKPERTRLFLFNKARGLVTTARDPEGRPTVFDALPPDLPRLVTIGRLDINTEGLLLLTNDGGLARLLELPSTGWIRRYRVRANGTVTQPELDALAKGVTVDGVAYAGIAAKLDRVQGANLWLTMGLKEGKNREIKRVLEHLGLAVTRLIRVSFGPFQLGELADNAVEEVRTRVIRDQLGSALVKQAGLDLEGPSGEATPAPAPDRSAERSPGRPAKGRRGAPVPAEPRRRTERAATADRRGRAVAVERIITPGGGEGGRGPRPRQQRAASLEQGSWRADSSPGFPAERAGGRGQDDRPPRSSAPPARGKGGFDERRSRDAGGARDVDGPRPRRPGRDEGAGREWPGGLAGPAPSRRGAPFRSGEEPGTRGRGRQDEAGRPGPSRGRDEESGRGFRAASPGRPPSRASAPGGRGGAENRSGGPSGGRFGGNAEGGQRPRPGGFGGGPRTGPGGRGPGAQAYGGKGEGRKGVGGPGGGGNGPGTRPGKGPSRSPGGGPGRGFGKGPGKGPGGRPGGAPGGGKGRAR